jgi:hypothetical protein
MFVAARKRRPRPAAADTAPPIVPDFMPAINMQAPIAPAKK